ncbi:MAG: glycoside hydrolase family 127 protein, partial [Bacteroidales bacterium]|nr:glycoside hydrolase family 127 protein [Bacteroidales bacterium]
EDIDKYAVQRGPLIFCAEWPDNPEGQVLNLVIDETPEFSPEFRGDLLNGAEIIKTKARQAVRNPDGTISLGEYEDVILIPYFLWANRGGGEMRVWLPYKETSAKPSPAPTIFS